MKIFVTGGSGFIGMEVIKFLTSNKYEVVTLSRTPKIKRPTSFLTEYYGDIRNRELLLKCLENVDVVIHLAGVKNDEKDSYSINVLGAKALISACKEKGVNRIINISTASTTLKNLGTYGRTKLEADKEFYSSGLKVTTLRPSVVYGDFNSGILGTLIKSTKRKIVPVVGDGETLFRPIHVRDLAIIIEKSIKTKKTVDKTYDVGGPEEISFNGLLKTVGSKVYGNKIRIVKIPVNLGLAIASVLKILQKKPFVTKSNILGLVQSSSLDVKKLNDDLKIKIVRFADGLDLVIKEKINKREPEMLYRYILSRAGLEYFIDDEDVTNYYLALKSNGLNDFIFSNEIYSMQEKLGAIDSFSKIFFPNSVLQKKLLLVTALIEASPISYKYLSPKNRNIFWLAIDSTAEVYRAVINLFAGAWIYLSSNTFFTKNVEQK